MVVALPVDGRKTFDRIKDNNPDFMSAHTLEVIWRRDCDIPTFDVNPLVVGNDGERDAVYQNALSKETPETLIEKCEVLLTKADPTKAGTNAP